jgi:hypothetical protein
MSPDPMGDIAAAVAVLSQSGNEAAVRIAEALTLWARSRTVSLERALGAGDTRNRNAALAALAGRLPGMSRRQTAEQVHSFVRRYETSAAWPRDRDVGHRPDGDLGLAYDILVNGGLPGVEHIRKSVLGDRGAFDPPSHLAKSAA